MEYEELIRLRAEIKYMKTEVEVIKKELALREEKLVKKTVTTKCDNCFFENVKVFL